jgi:hypothetical protein
MSAEHRRPAVAFVVLAIVAAAVVGIQRADAQGGRLLAAVIGVGVSVHGTLPQGEPLAASVLGDAGLFSGGSVLVLSDVPEEEAEAEVDGRSVVAAGAVARAAQRSDRTASGSARRDKAYRGRTTRARDDGKREVAAAARKTRSAEKRSPGRAASAAEVVAPSSRGASAVSTSSSPSHRPASTSMTVAQPRRTVVREDHRPVRARVGHHRNVDRKAHRKGHRAAHRAASRKSFRR